MTDKTSTRMIPIWTLAGLLTAVTFLAGGGVIAPPNVPTGGGLDDGRTVVADQTESDARQATPLPANQVPGRSDHGFAVLVTDFDDDGNAGTQAPGEGFDDWAIGYPQNDQVRVFFGGLHRPYGDPPETENPVTTAPTTQSQVTTPLSITGPAGSRFGSALAAADLDGNGQVDLVIGAPSSADRDDPNAGTGQAFVVWNVRQVAAAGGTAECLPAATPPACSEIQRPVNAAKQGDQFGWSVAAVGGLVVVGAPRWYTETTFQTTNPRVGRLEVYGYPTSVAGSSDDGPSTVFRRVRPDAVGREPGARAGGRGRTGRGEPGVAGLVFVRAIDGTMVGPSDDLVAEELGESLDVCRFDGVTPTIAAGAIGADAVRIYDLAGTQQGLLLDPFLLDPTEQQPGPTGIDGPNRPDGLFGSAVRCGDLVPTDVGDEIAVSATIRDWKAADNPEDSTPRANGGGVFVFDDLLSVLPGLQLRPQDSGEFLGFSLAAGKVKRTDSHDVLLVGSMRFDRTDSELQTASCDLPYANGGLFVLDLPNAPSSDVMMDVTQTTAGFVKYRVFGDRCQLVGGAAAIGDLNNDGWAEVLTSSNVDPNEASLRPDQDQTAATAGFVFIFSLNDADDDGQPNVVDPDDDDDCFADKWEDKNENGLLDADETSPFQANIDSLVSALSVTCSGGAACAPGDRLTIQFNIQRSCLALNPVGLATNPVRVNLRIHNNDMPITGNLVFVSSTPTGVPDTTQMYDEVLNWQLPATALSTTPSQVTAVYDIGQDGPPLRSTVQAAFPGSLLLDVEIAVVDPANQPIVEARGTFQDGGGTYRLVGLCDDNRTEPLDGNALCAPNDLDITQTVTATANPNIRFDRRPAVSPSCEFTFPAPRGLQEVACLPNAVLPGTVTVWNDGTRNEPAALEVEIPLSSTALICPGNNPDLCFRNNPECTAGQVPNVKAVCELANEIEGDTTFAAPALTLPVDWQIRDAVSNQTVNPSATLANNGAPIVSDTTEPPVGVAIPTIDLSSTCETSLCGPTDTVPYTITVQNIGGAPTEDGTIVFPIPTGTAYDSSPSCTFSASDNLVYCPIDEPATPGTITRNVDVTIGAGSNATIVANATVFYPGCVDPTNCQAAESVVNRPALLSIDNAPYLTLQKVVVNDSGGSATEADWTLTATGPTTLTGPGATVAGVVPVGTYTLSETGPPGYLASAWNCVGATLSGDQITLSNGDEVTCTITNDDQQTFITVVKDVINDEGGTAVPDDFNLTLDGNPVSSGVPVPVNPGTYVAAETPLTGYTFVGFSGDCDAGGSVTVALGDNLTCTLTNDDVQATVTVVKSVINDNGGTALPDDFNLTLDGNPVTSGVAVPVTPGLHTAAETLLPGYTFSGFSGDCNPAGNIAVGPGDNLTCTLTNDDVQATVTVVKAVVNDSGGTAVPADFSLTLDGNPVTTGVPVPVNPGAHVAAETPLAGYTLAGFSGDCDAGGNVTVALGENLTCTLTNDDDQATITVVKTVINDNTGTAAPDDFNLTLDGNPVTSGVAVPVNPGTHTAAETLLAGYTFSGFSGDCDAAGDVTIALGENLTCTLTNDDIP